VLENRNITDEERISQLEKELEETILLGEESDRKFEEVSVCPVLNHSPLILVRYPWLCSKLVQVLLIILLLSC